MSPDDKAFIQHLNELEMRCATEHFQNFNLCMDPATGQTFKVPEALEIISRSMILHDYDKVLNLNLSDLGLKRMEIVENQLSCAFISDVENDALVLYTRQLVLMFVGVSALQAFVRANATGPLPSKGQENFSLLTEVLGEDSCEALLAKNGEYLSDCLLNIRLLWLSHLFLKAASDMEEGSSLTCGWWHLRHITVHQRLLSERVAELHDRAKYVIENTVKMQWMEDESKIYQLGKVLFSVEAMQLHLRYHEVSVARRFLTTAQEIVGLKFDLDGAVGRRTRFQQKAVAQLVVKLEKGLFKGCLSTDECSLPKDLLLEDDTLLNKVAFVEGTDDSQAQLQPEEQVVLLGHCLLACRSEAADFLLHEQISSYVGCILEQPPLWCVYLQALFLRCKLEKESSRRVERALMQLESVLEALRAQDPPFAKRAPLLYATAFPMMWTLEKELADIQLSLGLTKSALSIYERLHLWEEMVCCLVKLGRTSVAEEVVRQQLEIKETPPLWCLLGDITEDLEAYFKADKLSGGKSARAQRSIGDYYFKRREYGKCIEPFSRSLEINHLQPDVWFKLGFTALEMEDYPLAAKAYRQQVVLQPEHFGAWNNLSKAYILTGQKDRAWRSLQEALKCNYEEWHTWETFLITSTDVGAFDDALRSWHRLLDLRGKYTDTCVLKILVKAINGGYDDRNGQPASRLRKSALELLGRLSAAVPNDCFVWEAYASLQCPDHKEETDSDRLEKAVLFQQKAVRHCPEGSCGVNIVEQLVQLTSSLLRLLEDADNRKVRYKSTARLMAQAELTKVKKAIGDIADVEKAQLTESIERLETSLAELQEL